MQNAVQQGITSVEDIDKMLSHVSRLCEEVVPELAWKSVSSTVEKAVKDITG